MKRTLILMVAILTLALAQTARADALVQARSDVPARVYVDGAYVGVTPIDVVIPRRGDHDVRFRAAGSRRDQAFVVHASGHHRTVTPLFAKLSHLCAPQPVVVTQPFVVQQPIVVTRPVVVTPYGYHGRRFWR